MVQPVNKNDFAEQMDKSAVKIADNIDLYMRQNYDGYTPIIKDFAEWGMPQNPSMAFVNMVTTNLLAKGWLSGRTSIGMAYEDRYGLKIVGSDELNQVLAANRSGKIIERLNEEIQAKYPSRNESGIIFVYFKDIGLNSTDQPMVQYLIQTYQNCQWQLVPQKLNGRAEDYCFKIS